jgi:hypothetical protein
MHSDALRAARVVPEQLAAGRGRRDARLPEHDKNAARWTPGLEATIFDNTEMAIASLEPDVDSREMTIRVAGPAALLIAKSREVLRGRPLRSDPAAGGNRVTLPPQLGA